MLATLKEIKQWVSDKWQPNMGEEDYRKMEYSVERHLHTPPARSPLTYEEEARIKTVIYH
ncbi:hypothetical protein [Paenibacillus sp. NFR01]|uniref:hypothetical protein n=1 Tax=Paenibacillus sp. NFR01 TaxID=1566279 RepID=UPI0008D6A2F6|nr:hypothetical protein [Paenibacillus sp. NFR01]SEU18458.1 hypothetical protein SAMN03159358_3791 [Paenibacillus sp. NFR01]